MMRTGFVVLVITSCAAIGLSACSAKNPSANATAAKATAANGMVFGAPLSGRYEVPPANSRVAAGTALVNYDKASRLATWDVAFSGLTSAATAAHIHGPAAADGNAAVVINLVPRNMFPVVSPLQGSATLSEAQAADLMAGKWYVNVHTANNPNGEIRGQLAPK